MSYWKKQVLLLIGESGVAFIPTKESNGIPCLQTRSYIWDIYLKCIKNTTIGDVFVHIFKKHPYVGDYHLLGGNKHVKSVGVFHPIRSCVSNVSDSVDGYLASKDSYNT